MAQNHHENHRVILLILMLAVLAQLASVKIAHGEAFLADDTLVHGLTVEIRTGATVEGDNIRLRQIARWSNADRATLDPIGELVVARFGQGMAFATVSMRDVKALLRDAGVNVATMNFAGATECQVNRSDATLPTAATMDQYVAAQPAVSGLSSKSPEKTEQSSVPEISAETPDGTFKTLRRALTQDLSTRLNVPAEDLELNFRPQDETSLRLTEPHVAFDIQPQRTGQLGDVSWNVNVVGDAGTKRLFIRGTARAWRQQTLINKPLATKQLITESDVVTLRKLVDNLPSDAVLSHDQIVGQMASRELKAGAVVTAKLVDPVQLVRGGQFVTMTTTAGGVSLKTVAKAMEPGTMGQTILVKNEVSKDQFSVVVTGDQQVSLAGK